MLLVERDGLPEVPVLVGVGPDLLQQSEEGLGPAGVGLLLLVAGAVLSPLVVVEGVGVVEHAHPVVGEVALGLRRQRVHVERRVQAGLRVRTAGLRAVLQPEPVDVQHRPRLHYFYPFQCSMYLQDFVRQEVGGHSLANR